MARTSHVPSDPDKLLTYLDAIEDEADLVLDTLPTKWKQAACLYRLGVPEPFGNDPPLFAVNLIRPAVLSSSALVTETKPQLDVKPRRDGLFQTAHMLKAVIEACWDELSVNIKLEDVQRRADVLSSCFVMLPWNRRAQHGWGNLEFLVKDPRQMKVDGALRDPADIDKAEYIIDRVVVPLGDVAADYPKVADQLKPCGRLSPIDDQERDRAARGLAARVKSGVYRIVRGSEPGLLDGGVPRVELKTYWVKDPAEDDDGPLYPGGRMIVRANNDVICEPDPEKQQNPYYDGLWPYEWLDGLPDLDSPWGGAETEAIKRIQDVFNKIGNAASQAIIREARSWVIADEGAIKNEDINTFVELGFRTVAKRRQYQFSHEPPGVTVASFQQWLMFCQGLIDYLTGVRDSSGGVGGRGRVELRSPGLLEGLQQAQQVLIRAKARRLEAMLERLGQKWISRVFQFYTVDRLMHFVNADGKWDVYKFEHAKLQAELLDLSLKRVNEMNRRKREELAEEDEVPPDLLPRTYSTETEILLAIKGAWRDLAFHVAPYSSLSSTRQARAAQLMQLNQNAMAPGWMVMEELGYSNAKELTQQAIEEAREKAAAGVPALMQQPKPGKRGQRGGK